MQSATVEPIATPGPDDHEPWRRSLLSQRKGNRIAGRPGELQGAWVNGGFVANQIDASGTAAWLAMEAEQ